MMRERGSPPWIISQTIFSRKGRERRRRNGKEEPLLPPLTVEDD